MITPSANRPDAMPRTDHISKDQHVPVNGHPWLTRADVIAAQCTPYSPESADHARTLAWEALTVRATAVATDLLAYARAADPSYPRLRFRPAQVQP